MKSSPLLPLSRPRVSRAVFLICGMALAGVTVAFDSARAGTGCGYSLIAPDPNLPLPQNGVHAYAQKSLHAGETIDFHVRSDVSYQLSIERLGWDVDSTATKDWTIHDFGGPFGGTPCSTSPGSYVHVERALPETMPLSELTLECWVRPFQHAWQGLITQYRFSTAAGFGLFIADDGRPAFYFGDGDAFNAAWLHYGSSAVPIQDWTHLCVTFDNGEAVLYVNGVPGPPVTGLPASVTPGAAPLRLGAYGEGGFTTHFLDGDLAMPAIYDRALDPLEVSARFGTLPPVPPDPASGCIGCWPLDEEGGATLADSSGCDRTGSIVNRGTWMIGGPGFDADSVGRFEIYDPDADPTRGHALRLSASDLYDCAWPVSHSYTLPPDLLPGLYVGRITYSVDQRYDVTFVVKKSVDRPAAPILVLCATATWQAYNDVFGEFNFYNAHAGGQPTYYQGENMPWPSADPYAEYLVPGYSHLVRAERFTHVWLEQNGYAYDVLSDRDLHENPGVLSQYRTVLILGHSEYWSREAYEGLRNYIASGGNVIVGSGNTMFWRVSYDDGVVECRKLPVSVGGFDNAAWGELYHEHDHERGGLMREAEMPAWQAVGLECVGYGSVPAATYQVTKPSHPFFHAPEPVSVGLGSELGFPGVLGHEWDVRLQTIPDPGMLKPPVPGDYAPVVLAEASDDVDRFDYQGNWLGQSSGVLSEIIDWKWDAPGSGRVFSVGSIATGRGLHADDNMAALFRNALHQLGVVWQVEAVAIATDGSLVSQHFNGSSWSESWQDLGGGFGDSPPTVVKRTPDSIAVMAITPSGDFRYRSRTGAGWDDWTTLGSGFTGRPAAVGWGRNRLQLFARDSVGVLQENAWDGTSWSGWTALADSIIVSDPTATSWEGSRLAVAALGQDGQVLYKSYDQGVWFPTPNTWQEMGGTFAHAPTLFSCHGNQLRLFAVASDGHLYHKLWNGSIWLPSETGWDDLGGTLASGVAVGARGGEEFSVFGIGTDGHLKVKWWDGSSWQPSPQGWQDLGGDLVGEPAVAAYRGETLSVLATGANGIAQHRLWDGTNWLPWQEMGGVGGLLHPSPAILPWIGTGSQDVATSVPPPIVRGADPNYLRLGANSPNPFHSSTLLEFEIQSAQHTRVSVYDTAGRLVAKLHDGPLSRGPQRFRWDGHASLGRPVASGVYFLEVVTENTRAARKVVLLR